ncbi:hypothetical protein B0H16DRAFT_1823324 [Mycena metata]|uniref:F-box domain-containing protein n=1 Tax=Mycena metata TaxID=1033252 RepID=A0AAD7GZ23_9AGAR|nr:hypothetical protein B0H16DRAFT_1823324 [Mycena metata]
MSEPLPAQRPPGPMDMEMDLVTDNHAQPLSAPPVSDTGDPFLPYDVLHSIFHEHKGAYFLAPEDMVKMQLVSRGFSEIFRPLIYRHVNMRSFEAAMTFFKTISSQPRLAASVRTLQLTFNVNSMADAVDSDTFSDSDTSSDDCPPCTFFVPAGRTHLRDNSRSTEIVIPYTIVEDDVPDENPYTTAEGGSSSSATDDPTNEAPHADPVFEEGSPWAVEFWEGFRSSLPLLVNLQTLNLSFDHRDRFFIRRFMEFGDLPHKLPPSVCTLHLKPLPGDYHFRNDQDLLSNTYFWDDEQWPYELRHIPHIHRFVLTTPTYVIWPPDNETYTDHLHGWTGRIRHTNSQLREIVLNFGFGDEGAVARTEIDKDLEALGESLSTVVELKLFNKGPKGVAPPFFYSRPIGGSVGTQVVWHQFGPRKARKTWSETAISASKHQTDRSEYFFGWEGQDYLYPWLLIDPEEQAGQFYRSQEFNCGIPGNFPVY